MSSLVTFIIVVLGLLLMGAILLQPGSKGGGLGSSFGGGGANSAFGAQGATPFLAKATYWLAGGFLSAVLIVEILIVKQGKSVLQKAPLTKTAPAASLPIAPPITPMAPAHNPVTPAPDAAKPAPPPAPPPKK